MDLPLGVASNVYRLSKTLERTENYGSKILPPFATYIFRLSQHPYPRKVKLVYNDWFLWLNMETRDVPYENLPGNHCLIPL